MPKVISGLYLVPGLPHLLHAAEQSPPWAALRHACHEVREALRATDAEVILYLSTQWYSVLGTMVQGRERMQGRHVDGNWHQLGSLGFDLSIDTELAQACYDEISASGETTKLIDYPGFPLDTGTIVAEALLNPDRRYKTAIVSCNIYADYAEIRALGAACRRALEKTGKKAAVVLVSSLSQRFFIQPIDPQADRLSSSGDDEWNRKILGLMAAGKIDEVAGCSPQFALEASADLGFKGFSWLLGVAGNDRLGPARVYSYQPIWGTGAAVCGFALSENPLPTTVLVDATKAPAPVGSYPHARRVGSLLFLSGIGPRLPEGRGIAGVEWDDQGRVVAYDISLQTRQVFTNIETILKEFNLGLEALVDVQVFLTDLVKDFNEFNRVYSEYFDFASGPTRTTIEVGALPTQIAIECKVVAHLPLS